MPTSLIINSSNARVLNRTAGIAFYDLSNPILLHGKAIGKLISLSIYNDMPNITSANDTITFTYIATPYTFVFPEGSYTMTDIRETLAERLNNAGLPLDLISLQADSSNSFVSLKAEYGANFFSMDYNLGNGVLNLLGFSGTFASATGVWEESSEKATINIVNAIIIHLSFASGAYLNNQGSSNAVDIAEFPPLESGSQFTHRPFHPNAFDINERVIDSFTVRLTTEDGKTPYITSEPYTLLITIDDNTV